MLVRLVVPLALLSAVFAVFIPTCAAQTSTTLTFLHTGDVRSNFLPVDSRDSECPPSTYQKLPGSCVGGASRKAAYINSVKARTPNPVLVFDSGNTFQGTLFFYRFRGMMGMQLMNQMNYSAANIGTREFDAGVDALAQAIDEAQFPVLGGNLNLTLDTHLKNIVKPYYIFNIEGKNVAVIGWVSEALPVEGSPGPTVSVMSTASRLRSIIEEVQTQYNAQIIIGLSENVKIDTDVALVQQVSGLDVVLGTYGDTLLLNKNPGGFNPVGSYPRVAQSPSGLPVLIASVGKLGKFIGHLNVTFDSRGIVSSWSGDAILMSNKTVPQPDPAVETFVLAKYNETQAFRNQIVGTAPVFLNASRDCRFGQCNLGSLMADIMRNRTGSQIALINQGGIIASIPQGSITFGNVVSAFPYQNTLATLSIRGSDLAEILRNSVSRAENKTNSGTGRFLQVSGLRMTWNPTVPATGSRVVSVDIWDADTQSFKQLQPQATYTVATSNFVAAGGDDYSTVLPTKALSLSLYGPGLDAVLIDFLRDNPTFDVPTDIRISTTTHTIESLFQRNVSRVDEGLKSAFIVITGICAIFPIAVMGYFNRHSAHAVVVTSSRPFIQLTLFASIITLAGLAAFILGNNSVGCMLFPWLSGIGFVIMYASLFAKTWRIWQVLKKVQSIKRRMITNKLLFGIVAAFVAIELVILIVWSIVSPLQYTKVSDPNLAIMIDYEICTSEHGLTFFIIGLVYKGILLLIGVALSLVTRKVDSDFRESKYIAFSIYSVFFTMVVVLIVLFVVGLNVLVRFVLTCLGIWIITCSVYLLLYVPKIMAVYSNPDNLWRGYFARRVQEMQQQFSKSRPAISGFGGSYISGFGTDSSSDLQENAKNMNRQQKKAYLKLVERNWEFLVSQKRHIENFLDSLRAELKLPPRDWAAEAGSVQTPREDAAEKNRDSLPQAPVHMSHDSVHSVIVREDGTHVAGGLRRAPTQTTSQLKVDIYDSSASDTGESSAS